MADILIYTFLLSISPFGEARTGIPYAIFNDVHFVPAFFIGLAANLLIYPVFTALIERFNQTFWKYGRYRRIVAKLSNMARKSAGPNIKKYGFWGLMVFVMIPLPGTGAYMGTIAAALFKIEKKAAFYSISIGVTISSVIMAIGSHFGNIGLDRL